MKLFTSIFLLILCLNIWAAPKKDLWPLWLKNNPDSTQIIDNSLYKEFLVKYVITDHSGVNLVKYSKVTTQDRRSLEDYLAYLSNIKISTYNRNEQLAYWANLYNAKTIDLILKHMPVRSILKINLGSILNSGPWDAKLVTVESERLSLNDIEHRIIRPIWNDSRTHYILNCASYSCPNLQKLPFSGKTINYDLNMAGKTYVNSQRGVNIKNDKLIVSQIYQWYSTDFGNNDKDIIRIISKFANPDLKRQLQKFNTIDEYVYDWSLNIWNR